MEETKTQNKKGKFGLFIPIIIAIIVVAGFFYFTSNNEKPENEQQKKSQTEESWEQVPDYKPAPVSRIDNPKRQNELDTSIGYGCAGPLAFEKMAILKEPDSQWTIRQTGETTKISLGQYRVIYPKDIIFDITKLWFYFYSPDLSSREDGIYGLENSYTSKMFINVNGQEQEIKLGGPEYMLIELDYPLGDLYPYDQAAAVEFEVSIEFQCKDGNCIDNAGQDLKYLNNKEVISVVRFFAVGCQEFTHDMEISSKFRVE